MKYKPAARSLSRTMRAPLAYRRTMHCDSISVCAWRFNPFNNCGALLVAAKCAAFTVLRWRWRLLEFAFDLRLLADDVAMDAFGANAFGADDFGVDAFGADDFGADDFGADVFDAFDATVAFDMDALDAFDAVDAPLRTRVILTRLVIGSLRWRLKVSVEMNHRCVDGRKRMIR